MAPPLRKSIKPTEVSLPKKQPPRPIQALPLPSSILNKHKQADPWSTKRNHVT